MGSFLGKQMEKVMDDNMRKQQEFMLSTQQMQVNPRCVVCGWKGSLGGHYTLEKPYLS